jgi:hypothetical protein
MPLRRGNGQAAAIGQLGDAQAPMGGDAGTVITG